MPVKLHQPRRTLGRTRKGQVAGAGRIAYCPVAPMAGTLLHAADLHLSFGSRTVFDSLTLTVEEGERVGLVGINGAGKSSLMKMLARTLPPDYGELQLRRGAKV